MDVEYFAAYTCYGGSTVDNPPIPLAVYLDLKKYIY